MENIKLEEVVSLFHKQPAEFIPTLKGDDGEWKPDALDIIKKAHSDFLTKTVETQSGKAVRLRMKEAEGAIGTVLKKYGLEKSDKLEDTLNLLVETIEKKKGEPQIVKEKEKLTDEEVRELPIFKTALKEGVKTAVEQQNSELQKRYEALETRYNATLKDQAERELNSILYSSVEKALVKAKVNLPDKEKDLDAYKAKINSVAKLVRADHQLKAENGTLVLVDSEGNQLEDKNTYQPILFDDVAANQGKLLWGTNNFDKGKGSAGAQTPNGNGSNGQRWTSGVPKNDSEFMDALLKETDSAKKQALTEAYQAYQTSKDSQQ